eukprot:TRINITY_DN1240_c0_g1_i1.p1 TRINITY_DN1240_c0_g1~~TRINITY_DN1240_c0_g1_i1.p1  ORF type:complete len:536 (+),score=114.38 TRINITY_DN1240_c0_g1_i1:51-1610(+)
MAPPPLRLCRRRPAAFGMSAALPSLPHLRTPCQRLHAALALLVLAGAIASADALQFATSADAEAEASSELSLAASTEEAVRSLENVVDSIRSAGEATAADLASTAPSAESVAGGSEVAHGKMNYHAVMQEMLSRFLQPEADSGVTSDAGANGAGAAKGESEDALDAAFAASLSAAVAAAPLAAAAPAFAAASSAASAAPAAAAAAPAAAALTATALAPAAASAAVAKTSLRTAVGLRAPGAKTRLAFLKTGRCGSSVLTHELVRAACSSEPNPVKCFTKNWRSEALYPWQQLNKSHFEVVQAINKEIVPASTCTGPSAACGWSICLSCVNHADVEKLVSTNYWKAVADVIINYDMQVLLMTRANPLEWAVSQVLAVNRSQLMKSSEEFKAIPGRTSMHYMPCSSYTLEGCSEAQQLWVSRQYVTVDLSAVREYVRFHRAVDRMFRRVRDYLRERNERQRILWVTMEDMHNNETWNEVYRFTGLAGEIPQMHESHGRYLSSISNYAELKRYAQELDVDFD